MVFEVSNTLGFLGFLALVPLIILYLIRPRPVNLKVPSLMFFFSRAKSTTAESILRHFQDDILFLIQLLVLSLLAFSLVGPLITINKDAVSGNIVFVLDASASSKVMEGSKTRFDIARERIKDLATARNSLVLAKSKPVLVLQGVGRSELVRYLDRVEATDDLTDISSAMILAAELLGDKKGRVVVLSDMISNKGIPIGLAKRVLEGKDIYTDFINTAKTIRKNVGIVNMVLTTDAANIYVKNYNNNDEEVIMRIGNDFKKLNVKAGGVEPLVLGLEEGDTEIEVQNGDDFQIDNKVIITRPYGNEIKVMLISNSQSKFLKAALNSIDKVKLTIAEPPVIPNGDYDVYIIDNVRKENLLPGTFEALNEKVRADKGNIIVVSWLGINDIDFKGLFPIEFLGRDKCGIISVDQVTRFTKDIDFGEVQNCYKVKLKRGVVVASVNNSAVVASFDVDKGKIVYYGIMDGESDFKLSPSYPIFWNNLIGHIAGIADLNELNLKTGNTLEISNITTLNLDKIGIYNVEDKKISVNLLSEEESDINLKENKLDLDIKPVNFKLDSVKVDVDYELDWYLVLIATLLIAFEFGYIKFRGEI